MGTNGLTIPLKEYLEQKKSCFQEKNTRIRKFKSLSPFFQHASENNSGIHSSFDDLKLNSLDQERNYKELVIGHNKHNTNINNINGRSEISVLTNCIIINFENINSRATKNTGNKKEIVNENLDMESNMQIKENTKKDVRTEENVIGNVSENFKNAYFEKISENKEINFKCSFDNDLKFLKKRNIHKIVVGQINIKLQEINLILSRQLLQEILTSY